MKFKIIAVLLIVACALNASPTRATEPLNVLIITIDDMNADSMGSFGCQLPDTTPNMDQLARQGMRFRHAHVQVGNCMPSRNVMWSGLYPHNNLVEGFYQVPHARHTHLVDLMNKARYFTAIRHKVSHSTPYSPYAWDLVLDSSPDGSKLHVKDAKSYGQSTKRGIEEAEKASKPFCLMINVADPHKPFYAYGRQGQTVSDQHVPTRIFKADEVPVPGFLFDDPVVRKELAHYYSSVRRADDCVGEIMSALKASGKQDQTVVLFLADHGMPLPFAKTQLYHHSTHTPLVIRWPGVTKANSEDGTHMVSAVDLLPTLADIVGAESPARIDGRSFAPLLRGGQQDDRELVFKEYNENAGASRDPMRAVQSKRFLYIFNPWSNGTRVMATATTGTPTYRRLATLAKTDPALAKRHDLYRYRVVEELYDVQDDPDCLRNLISQPKYAKQADALRDALAKWMNKTADPLLTVFQNRSDAQAREQYVVKVEREAQQRRKQRRPKQKKNSTRKKKAQPQRDLFSWALPKSVRSGQEVAVVLKYKLPEQLGKQLAHVTLKDANNKRVERKVVELTGTGQQEVRFKIPAQAKGTVRLAAFIGKDFQSNLQYQLSPPIAVH